MLSDGNESHGPLHTSFYFHLVTLCVPEPLSVYLESVIGQLLLRIIAPH